MSLVPVPKVENEMQIEEKSVDKNSLEYKTAFNSFLQKLDNQPIKILKEYLEKLDNILHSPKLDEIQLKALLIKLKETVENFDEAKMFVDLHGFDYIPQLLQIDSNEIKELTCDLLAELVQNHKFCQEEAYKHNIVPIILKTYEDGNNDVKIKAFYALSNLLRGNLNMQNQFMSLGGTEFILKALQSFVHKIRLKATLLVIYMCLENSEFKKNIHQNNILKQLLKNAMMYEHDLSHEHTINAIVTLAKTDPDVLKQLKCECPDLKSFLLKRGAMLNGKPEFAEENNYVKTLYEMCFEDDLNEAVQNLNLPKN